VGVQGSKQSPACVDPSTTSIDQSTKAPDRISRRDPTKYTRTGEGDEKDDGRPGEPHIIAGLANIDEVVLLRSGHGQQADRGPGHRHHHGGARSSAGQHLHDQDDDDDDEQEPASSVCLLLSVGSIERSIDFGEWRRRARACLFRNEWEEEEEKERQWISTHARTRTFQFDLVWGHARWQPLMAFLSCCWSLLMLNLQAGPPRSRDQESTVSESVIKSNEQ
jgi:hypothetical protein